MNSTVGSTFSKRKMIKRFQTFETKLLELAIKQIIMNPIKLLVENKCSY